MSTLEERFISILDPDFLTKVKLVIQFQDIMFLFRVLKAVVCELPYFRFFHLFGKNQAIYYEVNHQIDC